MKGDFLWSSRSVFIGSGEEKFILRTVYLGGLIGLVPWTLSHVGNAPPPDRLLGKSPAYVEIYVAAYGEERQGIKKEYGRWRTLLGILVGGIAAVSIVASQQ